MNRKRSHRLSKKPFITRTMGLSPWVLVVGLLAGCAEPAEPLPDFVGDPFSLVDPRIGTGGHYFGVGSGFAGAALPFGMAKPGPDTTGPNGAESFHHCSGYHADDTIIIGFSQVHIHGTGAPDYGALLLQPVLQAPDEPWREGDYASRFDKNTENMEPGYYSVLLADSGIQVELTATERCALHRYSYPTGQATGELIIDLGHAIAGCRAGPAELHVDGSAAEVSGWMQYSGSLTGRSGGVRLFFVARFSTSFTDWRTWSDGTISQQAASTQGQDVGAVLRLDTSQPVTVRLGLSPVDEQGARNNLERELAGLDFDDTRGQARGVWQEMLGLIKVAGGDEQQRVIFYTALYHALLTPTLYTDVDGRYRAFDNQIHQADGFTYYTDFSLWDTYRTVHSLFALILPGRQRDMVLSLLDMGRHLGYLPRWPAGVGDSGSMIGTPAEIVIADSYLRGVGSFDAAQALATLVADASADRPDGGREGFARYTELGFLPADEFSHATAKTLEFAIADAAVAALARELGEDELAERFAARAQNYRNVFDPGSGFMRGRLADGSWLEPFDPLNWNAPEYDEGTAWQYLWLSPQDPEGLAELLGGTGPAAEKLQAFFSTPEPDDPLKEFLPKIYYWHGNEPDLHAAYLFNHFGRPDLAQYWVRQILASRYGTGPDGLAGNDDCGTLSAWYLLSASGIYPLAGLPVWELGSPLFTRVLFATGGEHGLEVRALAASADNLYVQSLRLNGQALDEPRLSARQLAQATLLEFELGPEPGDLPR